MRILHISDTHSKHRELPLLPNADIIIHSGDFTFTGSENEAYEPMEFKQITFVLRLFTKVSQRAVLSMANLLSLPIDYVLRQSLSANCCQWAVR